MNLTQQPPAARRFADGDRVIYAPSHGGPDVLAGHVGTVVRAWQNVMDGAPLEICYGVNFGGARGVSIPESELRPA
jgi:hypothetical protein